MKSMGAGVKMHGASAVPHAIVKDGVVVNVVSWDSKEFPKWRPVEGEAVPCDDTVAVGYLWDGVRFSNPNAKSRVVLTLDEAKARRIAEIDAAYAGIALRLSVSDTAKDQARKAGLVAIDAVRAAQSREEARQISSDFVSQVRGMS